MDHYLRRITTQPPADNPSQRITDKEPTMYDEMYRSIIRSYYHHKDNEDCYFAAEAVAIVEIGTDGCTIFDTAEQCFEESVKADIEESYSVDDPFDFSIFSRDQLDFMLGAYQISTVMPLALAMGM